MSNTSLEGVDHSFEFTQQGEDHTCIVRVTLPDGTIQMFEATSGTRHAARVIAVFKASFAVKCANDFSASLVQQEQDAPAPSEEGVEASRESSPKSLDVDSRELGVHDDMLLDAPVEQYSSSAEDEDDELPVAKKRRSAPSAPIAFVPAPESALKTSFTELKGDEIRQNRLDERPSLERTSPCEAEPQHVQDLLEAELPRERSGESSELENGELTDPDREILRKQNDYKSLLARRKSKYSLAKPKLPSPRESSPDVYEISTSSQKRVKRFRTEPLAPRQRNSRRESRGHGSSARVRPSTQKRRAAKEVSHAPGPTRQGRRRRDPRASKEREKHNAELPQTSDCINQYERIPRHNHGQMADDVDLDMTQTNNHNSTPFYPPQPHDQSAAHAQKDPGQLPNPTPPFPPHHIYQGTAANAMAYTSQYVAPHFAHQHPNVGASFPPGAPYTTTNPMLAPGYMNPGFPPQMMPQAIGGYHYHPGIPSGTHPFYPPTPQAYHPSQLPTAQKVQHDAHLIAAAAQRTAELAAEAAAKDAARNARHDFEIHLREKQAERMNETHSDSRKPVGKGHELPVSEPEKESGTAGHATNKKGAEQRHGSGDGTKVVDTIPVEETDLGDYISTLHKMVQKGQICANLSPPSFVTVRSRNEPRCGQECTMSVRFVPDSESDDGLITKTALAAKKKTAKQLVAKALLAEIEDRMKSQPQSSEEEGGQKDKVGKTSLQKKNSGITTAVTALHRLYTLNVLYGPPIFKPEEPAGGPNKGTWRSVVIVEIKDIGKRTYEEFGSSKKIARQKCASKAFEALREMEVPGIDTFPNVTNDGRDLENETTAVDNSTTKTVVNQEMSAAEDAAPIEAIVAISDDEEVSNSSIDAELAPSDDQLLLPKDYKLVFPTTEAECDAWLKDNCETDAQFGLFVDSPRARAVFMNGASPTLQKVAKEQQPLQPSFLCLSTATTGMVLCFPEADSAMRGALSSDDENYSLPEVVVDVLEDPNTKKSGYALEDGISVLELEENFRTHSVNDVSIVSLAITGVERVTRTGPLASLPELIKHWLRKETGKISVKGAWKDPGDIPARLKAGNGKEITVGVLASYACFCISQQMKPAARQKRTRTHGVAAAFLHLSEQLMSPAPA